jgi:hypothetical protein
VFHQEAFLNISAKKIIVPSFLYFFTKRGELSSISLELTGVQDFSLGMLYEQAVGKQIGTPICSSLIF